VQLCTELGNQIGFNLGIP